MAPEIPCPTAIDDDFGLTLPFGDDLAQGTAVGPVAELAGAAFQRPVFPNACNWGKQIKRSKFGRNLSNIKLNSIM
jgi:hypothetical protein